MSSTARLRPTEATAAERRAKCRTYDGFRYVTRARSTGAVVVVLNAAEAGLDVDAGPWATICEDHDRIVHHADLATARSWASCPEGFCGVCDGTEPADDHDEDGPA